MLEPLKQWICDKCGELIERPEDGYVEWISDYNPEGSTARRFKIVHHSPASPRQPYSDCYIYNASSLALPDLLGPKGLVILLGMLDVGPYHDPDETHSPKIRDFREYTEFFRRLHLPYYEQARLYWDRAASDGWFADGNDVWIYLPDTLRKLVAKYEHSE